MAKYLGPKTDPANVASQSDVDGKPSLSSTNPTTIEPDASAAVGTGTTAARADHTHAIAAASAGTITGTNAEGTSTSFARADHNHAFGSKSVPASALALGPTYETSLPGSPTDGQEIYYQDTGQMATDGIVWHLRYRSGGGTYKWEFVGGSALRGSSAAEPTLTNKTTFQDLDGSPVIVTLPLAGEYEVVAAAQIVMSGTGFAQYAYAITNSSNTVQSEATAALSAFMEGASGTSGNVYANNLYTISTAGWKLRERGRTGGNYSAIYARRRVIVRPIRVG
jgi:hypothetical protein